jgi:hypothetical protein
MKYWIVSALFAVVSLTSVQAQDSALKYIPSDAPIVVHMKGVATLQKRLSSMLENAAPDVATKLLDQSKGMIQLISFGRDLKGLDTAKPISFAVLDLESLGKPEKSLALYVPVTDAKAFRKGFFTEAEQGTFKQLKGFESFEFQTFEGYLVPKDGYAVITTDKDFAKELTEKFDSLEDKLSASLKKSVSETDLGLIVNMEEIQDLYGAQLKQFRTLIDFALQQGGGQIDKKQIEMAKMMFDGLLQVIDDGKATLVSFQFRPEGLSLKLHGNFKEGSKVAKNIADFTGADQKLIETFPAGQMTYSAVQLGDGYSKLMSMLMSQAIPSDADDKATESYKEAAALLDSAVLKTALGSMNFPMSGVSLMQYGDPIKAEAGMLKMYKGVSEGGTLQNVPLASKPLIKEKAETVSGITFNHVAMKLDFDKASEQMPEQMRESMKQSMMKMMGEETKMWFGIDGKYILQVTAKNWNEAKSLIEKYKAGQDQVGKQLAFQLTRKNMPEKVAYLSMSDSVKLMALMYDSMKTSLAAVPGFPATFPELKFKDAKPSYIGMSFVGGGNDGSIEIFVPATAVQQIRKVIAPLLQKSDDD